MSILTKKNPTNNNTLRITEIFYSLQGETRASGLPTIFIRLTGCPLRCHYCDTAYAFHGGKNWSLSEIMDHIQPYQTRYVTVTGGEPLAQPTCLALLTQLCDKQYTVQLETSGALDVSAVDPRVIKILDLKTPGSGEESRNDWNNLQHLQPHDQIKFVLTNRNDYDWARTILAQHALANNNEVLFSPAYATLPPDQLADWILQDGLPVRFQLQLHKALWGDVKGR